MKSSELRIGNKVLYKGLVREMLSLQPTHVKICENPIAVFKLSELEPIPLSPEILEKCGFVKTWDFDNGSVENYSRDPINIQVVFIDDPITFQFVFWNAFPADKKSQKVIEIKYVHQLQNLYYALTQTELKIDL